MKRYLLGLMALALCSPGFGQEARGRVQGAVTDSTQAIVVGAKVLLTNTQTNVVDAKETGANGHYLFDLVLPGQYTVMVERAGFAKFTQQNITVPVHGDVTVDALLKVGANAESVTITEAPPQVQFNSSTMDQVIDHKMVKALPTLARNPFALAILDPAVTN